MDKNTLSNYGWIVIAVLVLAVMIALATPFGTYIKSGVESTTQGLFDTSEKAMNVVGMSAKGDNNISNENVDTKKGLRAIAHAGLKGIAPTNTLPGYQLAVEKGFKYVEGDIRFTLDGVAVLCHDNDISTFSNGTGNISYMTYEQLLQYDFGSWKSEEYAGTKILTFEDWMEFCAENNLHPYIELKAGTEAQIKSLIDTAKTHNIQEMTFISNNKTYLTYVKDYDNSIRLYYTAEYANSTKITEAQNLKTDENEVVLFVRHGNITADGIALCKEVNIPLELWGLDDTKANLDTILKMDPYISGITCDNMNIEKFYDESRFEVVKTLDASDITYGVSTYTNQPPYYQSNPNRAAYTKLDISMESGYVYKLEFTSKIDTITIAGNIITNAAADAINNNTTFQMSGLIDTKWQKSGYMLVTPSEAKYIRVLFGNSAALTEPIEEGTITSVTISRIAI